MKKIISVLLLFVIFLTSCNRVEYFETTGWNCTDENFQTYYRGLYKAKIAELKELYDLTFSEKESEEYNSKYQLCLYNDDFTIQIKFANGEELACYQIDLFYYGDSEASRKDYEKQRPLVNFINDFTNYVAFDTKTDKNYFEALYNECKKSKGKPTVIYSYQYDSIASNIYHYDSVVGNIGYSVTLNYNAYGEYYKMQGNSDCMAFCNHYSFYGLLKPI